MNKHPAESFEFAYQSIRLFGLTPVINNIRWDNASTNKRKTDQADIIEFWQVDEPQIRFFVEINEDDQTSITYRVEGLDPETRLDSFGICFSSIQGLRSYLRNGYHSWDGSNFINLDHQSSGTSPEIVQQIGYAMTQLIPLEGSGSLVIGFDRHDRFQHSFIFDHTDEKLQLQINTLWDQKPIQDGKSPQSEKLWILKTQQVEAGLGAWAVLVARASPLAPRVSKSPITGWSSWYNLYAAISEENICEHLDSARKTRDQYDLNLKVFQIDDGFTPEMGDWLEVKPQFPQGMKPILDKIRGNGFTPGLWIAPFMIGNRSKIFQRYPDWVVRDRENGAPLVQMKFYGEFRWHKRSEEYYILDCTHPDALNYLKHVFSVWRNEWGCEYFKTDFMFFGAEYGPDKAIYHTPGMSRIEIWRLAASAIRSAIGDALWLGCGVPLWASVGLIDAARIGRDMGVSWRGERAATDLLADIVNRNFANHRLWQSDPDCLLLRDHFHYLNRDEIQSLAIFSAMTGGVIMTSDKLDEIPENSLRILADFASKTKKQCRFLQLEKLNLSQPVDLQRLSIQVRHSLCNHEFIEAIYLFNISDTPIEAQIDLQEICPHQNNLWTNWQDGSRFSNTEEAFYFQLAPHQGLLLISDLMD